MPACGNAKWSCPDVSFRTEAVQSIIGGFKYWISIVQGIAKIRHGPCRGPCNGFQNSGRVSAAALDALKFFPELLPEDRPAIHQIPRVALMASTVAAVA